MNKILNASQPITLNVGAKPLGEGKLNEGPKFDEVKANMEKTMGLLVRKMGLKSVGKHLVGKGGMSFFLDDPKEAKKLQKERDEILNINRSMARSIEALKKAVEGIGSVT